ncbi:hypothetical protein SNEBB_010324 [Seison nebaliae]|nr:hypothetical protein SNEBB_010324 [Seison nebaliae]
MFPAQPALSMTELASQSGMPSYLFQNSTIINDPKIQSNSAISSSHVQTINRNKSDYYYPLPSARPQSQQLVNKSKQLAQNLRSLAAENMTGRVVCSDPTEFRKAHPSLMNEGPHANNCLAPSEIYLYRKLNRQDHHTEEYQFNRLIIRRGDKFRIGIVLNKDFDGEKDYLLIQFATGSRPLSSQSTLIRLPVKSTEVEEQGWKLSTFSYEKDSKLLQLDITPSVKCNIGKYQLYVETQSLPDKDSKNLNDIRSHRFRYAEDIYILFNCFNENEETYLPVSEAREEYLKKTFGHIFIGHQSAPQKRFWYFDQFAFGVLDTALNLLDQSGHQSHSRWKCDTVINTINSQIVATHQNHQGMILGKWHQHHQTHPNSTSSDPFQVNCAAEIIKNFFRIGKPFRYGNSVTFAAVQATLLRALGVPCRIVTGFNVALDVLETNHASNIHWNRNGKLLRALNVDTIAMYHCWNEIYLNGDWKAVDPMPHLGCNQSKPIDVNERNGEKFQRMLNGTEANWLVENNGNVNLINVNKEALGSKIITSSIDDEVDPIDLTDEYKSNETSFDDNRSLLRRLRQNVNDDDSDDDNDDEINQSQISATATLPLAPHVNGENIKIECEIKNESDENKTVKVFCQPVICFPTGVPFLHLKPNQETVEIESNEEEKRTFITSLSQYGENTMFLNRQEWLIRYIILFHNPEHDEFLSHTLSTTFIYPSKNLLRTVMDRNKHSKENGGRLKVIVYNSFKDRLPLTNVKISLLGLKERGDNKNRSMALGRPLDHGQKAEIFLPLPPKESDEQTKLLLTMNCDQIGTYSKYIYLSKMSEKID